MNTFKLVTIRERKIYLLRYIFATIGSNHDEDLDHEINDSDSDFISYEDIDINSSIDKDENVLIINTLFM